MFVIQKHLACFQMEHNKLIKMLSPYVEKYDAVYNKSPEFSTNIMRNVDQFADKMATENVVDYVMLNQIYDYYSKDKENWQNLMNIEFQKHQ